MAEYRRRRATGWQTWKPTFTLRIAGVLVTGLSTGLLTAAVADTLAWRRGTTGERRTARLLAPLERYGYQVFHDLAVPGSAASTGRWWISDQG